MWDKEQRFVDNATLPRFLSAEDEVATKGSVFISGGGQVGGRSHFRQYGIQLTSAGPEGAPDFSDMCQLNLFGQG